MLNALLIFFISFSGVSTTNVHEQHKSNSLDDTTSELAHKEDSKLQSLTAPSWVSSILKSSGSTVGQNYCNTVHIQSSVPISNHSLRSDKQSSFANPDHEKTSRSIQNKGAYNTILNYIIHVIM